MEKQGQDAKNAKAWEYVYTTNRRPDVLTAEVVVCAVISKSDTDVNYAKVAGVHVTRKQGVHMGNPKSMHAYNATKKEYVLMEQCDSNV